MKTIRTFAGLFFIIAFTQISEAFSQETWEKAESQFCTVYHRQDIDFRLISRRLDIRAIQTTNIRKASGKEGEKEVFLEKLDTIFKKVEEVLDMYPSRINVNIKVFSSQDGLDKAYEELFNEPNTTVSFYVFKTNTIYTTEKAISESILAHEMAHCIIDHYFVILPPRKVQEILAVYADMHLFD